MQAGRAPVSLTDRPPRLAAACLEGNAVQPPQRPGIGRWHKVARLRARRMLQRVETGRLKTLQTSMKQEGWRYSCLRDSINDPLALWRRGTVRKAAASRESFRLPSDQKSVEGPAARAQQFVTISLTAVGVVLFPCRCHWYTTSYAASSGRADSRRTCIPLFLTSTANQRLFLTPQAVRCPGSGRRC